MSLHNLDAFFGAQHVALIGASPRAGSVGRAFAENLLAEPGGRRLSFVNPNHSDVLGHPCVPALNALHAVPDLAIIATPPESVPGLIAEAKLAGVRSAVVVSGCSGGDRGALRRAMRAAAKGSDLRILGPESQGLWAAASGLNATLAVAPPQPGTLGLIAQSGAIMNAVLDWGNAVKVGFSKAISLGDASDVDLDDLLDHLAYDVRTRAILVCVETIGDPRRFYSAARAAAKVKPVVILKSGRHRKPERKLATHSALLATEDAAYDAAIQRAGLLRVHDLDGLFDAAEALVRLKRPSETGKRLAIVTNDGGIGILAADRLLDHGGTLAGLGDEALASIQPFAPLHWSGTMPLDLDTALPLEHHDTVIEALIDDPQNDAVLVAYSPNRLSGGVEQAKRLADLIARKTKDRSRPKPVLVSWLERDPDALAAFDEGNVARFRTPGDAVRGFLDISRYASAQRELSETPPALPQDLASADVARVRSICDGAIEQDRTWLNPTEVADVLATYGIAHAAPIRAADAEAARQAADTLLGAHRAVAVKIDSPDLPHKSDVGGVVLDLAHPEHVAAATDGLFERVKARTPNTRIEGVTVQPMIDTSGGLELILGLADDPVFGPVIVFGRGGVAVEAIGDTTLDLPPLDMRLAHQMIERTRVARLLKGHRGHSPLDEDAVADGLVRLSQLSADVPQLRRLDLNPVLVTASGIMVLDARMQVERGAVGDATFDTNPRFTIRPYPRNWERRLGLKDGSQVFVRPVRAEDEPAFRDFFAKTDREDLRLRFFSYVRDFSHKFIARLTQIDYARDMAFGAFDGSGELIGVVRLHADPEREAGEYAILLRSDLKGQGLGWLLMKLVIEYGQAERFKRIEGQVLAENTTMLSMCQALGFSLKRDHNEPEIVECKLVLDGFDAGSLSRET
ncbi:MAG: bifunctional acetate--CoA ligase family protein/GNAT family N-acetyltransferase [Devosiaceae bacterium]|nr:bifunctional acetate--CoA ligase family protein/GNAT family N-acetyltransferase [Devosiaceae bacterium MH13]